MEFHSLLSQTKCFFGLARSVFFQPLTLLSLLTPVLILTSCDKNAVFDMNDKNTILSFKLVFQKMIGQYKTNLLYLWAIFFSQEQPVYWMTELMTKLKTKLEMHEYLFILPYYLHWTLCAMLEKYKTMHCFCFLALTLSNIWCPCLKSLCIEARYKGTEGFFSAFLDWGWKVLLFKMVYHPKSL